MSRQAQELESRIQLTALTPVPLATLTGALGTVLTDPGGNFGSSVNSVGDVNGDGLGDFATRSDSFVYVVFGQTGGLGASFDVTTLDGTNGFEVVGVQPVGDEPRSVGGADVNGDGLSDLLFGDGGNGQAWVVFGRPSGFGSSVDLNALPPGDRVLITGTDSTGHGLGNSISLAGDVNGDGLQDIIVSAKTDPTLGTGTSSAYVFYGRPTWGASVDVSDLDGTNGFAISTAVNSGSSVPVHEAGDIDSDGLGDVIVSWENSNETAVVFGQSTAMPPRIRVSDLDGTNGFEITGTIFNRDVSGGGDFNGDGKDDIIIGVPDTSPNVRLRAGSTFVVYGSENLFPPVVDLESLDGTNGVRIDAHPNDGRAGHSIDWSDVNGDGNDDAIIGSPGNTSRTPATTGMTYVVFGGPNPPATFNLQDIDGDNGFVIAGVAADDLVGQSVAGLLDVNGDGIQDILVGDGGSGDSYIVYGGNFTLSITQQGDAGDTVLNGTAGADVFNSGFGDDILDGQGGADVFYAGPGNDQIIIPDDTVRRVDGGAGNSDVLRLTGTDINYDFTDRSLPQITGIEEIDLDGTGNLVITIPFRELVRLSDTSNTLTVRGDPGDVVHRGEGWSMTGTVTDDGVTYDAYTQGAGTLLIQQGMTTDTAEPPTDINVTPNAISENATNGTVIGTVGATDPNSSDTHTYELTDDLSGMLELNFDPTTEITTVVLKDNTLLDAETNRQLIPRIRVTDSAGLSWEQQIEIQVTDFLTDGVLSVDHIVDGVNGSELSDDPASDFGTGIDSGDLNRDGIDDLVIGAPGDGNGRVEIWLADPNGEFDTTAGAINYTIESSALDAALGQSVAIVGDINGDAFPDVLIGGSGNNPDEPGQNHGRSYLIYGGTDKFEVADGADGTDDNVIHLDSFTADYGYRLLGTQDAAATFFGVPEQHVAGPGDVNGDGIPDIAISEVNHINASGEAVGGVRIIYGGTDLLSDLDGADGSLDGTIHTPNVDGTTGFLFEGVSENSATGLTLSGAGDVNGDDVNDLLIGAPQADPNGDPNSRSGEAYVVFGGSGLTTLDGNADGLISLSDLDGSATGYRIRENASFARTGNHVSGGGDFDGDGVPDIVVSSDGSSFTGKVAVLRGGAANLLALDTRDGTLDGIITLPAEPAGNDPPTGDTLAFVEEGVPSVRIPHGAKIIDGKLVLTSCELAAGNVTHYVLEATAATGSGDVKGLDLDKATQKFTSAESGSTSESTSVIPVAGRLGIANGGHATVAIADLFEPISEFGVSVDLKRAPFKVSGNTAQVDGFRFKARFTVTNNGTKPDDVQVVLELIADRSMGTLDATVETDFGTAPNGILVNRLPGEISIRRDLVLAPGQSVEFEVEITSTIGFRYVGRVVNMDDPNINGNNRDEGEIMEVSPLQGFAVLLTGDASLIETQAAVSGATLEVDMTDLDGTTVTRFETAGSGITSVNVDAKQRTSSVHARVEDDAQTNDGESKATIDGIQIGFDQNVDHFEIQGSDFGDDLQFNSLDGSVSKLEMTLDGFGGNDILVGGIWNDLIRAGDGNDVCSGGAGNDHIVGGAGDDTCRGGAGDDVCEGGGGADDLDGDNGHDVLDGYYLDPDSDRHIADLEDDEADVLEGGSGDDVISGGDGDDFIYGESLECDGDTCVAGNDMLAGDAGNDMIWGDWQSCQSDCTGGDDMLAGGDGDDVMHGDAEFCESQCNGGDDQIDGGMGDDTGFGGDGDDLYFEVPGSDDSFTDSGGFDTLDFSAATAAITINLGLSAGQVQTVDAGGNSVALSGDFEALIGSAFADSLTGSDLANTIAGGDGNDSIFGLGGNDNLTGGDGLDELTGGEGDDIVDGQAGDDMVLGGPGDDQLLGGEGNDHLESEAGDDIFRGGPQNDTIFGGGDNDMLFGEDGDDELHGEGGDDQLDGGAGNDLIFGGADNDVLAGGAGTDSFDGEGGNDTVADHEDGESLSAPLVEIDLRLVTSPTATVDGEVTMLPENSRYIDEWEEFLVEVYGSTPLDMTSAVSTFSVDVPFDPAVFEAVSLSYGPLFTESQLGAIDNTSGRVTGLSAGTLETDAGVDDFVLLASVSLRVRADADLPNDRVAGYILPIQDDDFDTEQLAAGVTAGGSALSAPADAIVANIWPVMYDLDDNGTISFGDVSIFAGQFGQMVSMSDTAFRADFDRNGNVSFGDVTVFAQNFGRSRSDTGRQSYTGNFPEAWEPQALQLASSASALRLDTAQRLTADSIDLLLPLRDAAIDRLGVDDRAAESLRSIEITVADLPGGYLGLATDDGVVIDVDASGAGWFIDSTPHDDLEFKEDGLTQSAARRRVDLLSVIAHELGHHLGLDHDDDGMNARLSAGQREVPRLQVLDAEFTTFPEIVDWL